MCIYIYRYLDIEISFKICHGFQITAMRVEIGRLNEENKNLRNMLSQANGAYEALHMHLIRLMQQRDLNKRNSLNHDVHIRTYIYIMFYLFFS